MPQQPPREQGKRRKKREEVPETRESRLKKIQDWKPRTALGKKVLSGEIDSIDQVFAKNTKIMEPEIIDYLVGDLQEQVVEFTKTAKVRRSGRQFSFRAAVLIGDGNSLIGLGVANDKEKWPAVRKATKNAKLNLLKVRKSCGSWECTCGLGHSIPFAVEGKSASVRVKLMPAPKGTGLVVGKPIRDVFRYVGITDIWSSTRGNTSTRLNFVRAAIDALNSTHKMKVSDELAERLK